MVFHQSHTNGRMRADCICMASAANLRSNLKGARWQFDDSFVLPALFAPSMVVKAMEEGEGDVMEEVEGVLEEMVEMDTISVAATEMAVARSM